MMRIALASIALLVLTGGTVMSRAQTADTLGDFGGQCRYAWDKIKRLLQKHDATVENIDKVVTYVTDIRYFLMLANVVRRLMPGQPNRPAPSW